MNKNLKTVFHKILFVSVLCMIFLAGVLLFHNDQDTSSAHADGKKNVKSVLICRGDTLWSIAKEYHTDLNGELHDYIEEIRTVNKLQSHNIHMGNYILVPYFE